MGPLPNVKHEKFALLLAEADPKLSDDDRYVAAGYKSNPGNACRLKNDEKVMGRVAELQKAAEEKALEANSLTKEWVIRELQKTYEKATEVNQISAAVGALKLLGAESGMFTERSKTEGDVRWVVGSTMSDEDKVTDNNQWSDKFAEASKPSLNGANGANGHS